MLIYVLFDVIYTKFLHTILNVKAQSETTQGKTSTRLFWNNTFKNE